MKAKLFSNSLLLIITIIIINGCIPSKPPDEERILPPDRLIKKLEANRRQIKSFSGTGILNVKSPEMTAKANFEILIKKPDSIKVSIFGPFAIGAAQILVTPNSFKFYDELNNVMYQGVNREGIIERIFKIDVSFDDLIDAFTGSVNLTDKLKEEPNKFETEGDSYLLSYIPIKSNKVYIYKVNIDDLAITNYRIAKLPNEILFDSKYSNFSLFEEVAIPYLVNLKNKQSNQTVDIEYRNIKVNTSIQHLEIIVPQDVKIFEW
ncbi:MAG: DUF4292 domain-containing protein [Ignavibacteriales bacterium]|nr:DUF4292 domain-containing protein [Ignavibacteriales bacterium]